jgi:PAS domain-containing protein
MPENDKKESPRATEVRSLDALKTVPAAPIRPWRDILPDEMGSEMLTRDGRFQIMVSFMRISPMAALIIDDVDRIIFMNASAERYWKVRVWDVRGKVLGEIMKLDEREKKTMSNEHLNVLEGSIGGGAQVFYEHFHNGAERLSMLKFPFTEDDNYRLIGCFVLPSSGSTDPKLQY